MSNSRSISRSISRSNSRSISRTLAIGLGAVGLVVTAAAATGIAAADGGALHASAILIDATGAEVGTARLVEDATGTVHVNVKVSGLSEGLHGAHVHAIGVCTPDTFVSAGGHHNPLGRKHGTESVDADGNHVGPHAGDLPNLTANVAGRGHLDATTDELTISAGARSILDENGSAIVIHAGPDDLTTDPTGNSGARVACGVIVAD